MFSPYTGQQFLNELRSYCGDVLSLTDLQVKHKSDQSLVTIIDQKLSDFCKSNKASQGFSFYSEEEHSTLQFPAMIVDPIDGTRELVAGRGECAVSVAWMSSPKLSDGFGVIYNPFTGFALTSADTPAWQAKPQTEKPLGLVSRSEWEKGLFTNSKANLQPRGSIAFKLALLASGACDYVVSLKPKNIWDIAAGTVLCHQRGMEFWSEGKKITDLSEANYQAPLIWARPELITSLRAQF